MSQETPLLESLVDGVLTLTMNRPEARNALNLDMGERLLVALRRAGARRPPRPRADACSSARARCFPSAATYARR